MSNLAFRLRIAKQTAEKLLHEDGLLTLPVPIQVIAESRDILVQAKPDTAEGVSGMLLRHGDQFGILYATHIDNEGFQRFSIAHELGHYFLDGHLDQVLKAGLHQSQAGFRSNDPYEMEADAFASGLLMPTEPCRRELARVDDGMDAVLHLRAKCCTSVTASAIRYAELTEAAVAVVVSRGSVVDYCIMSERMKDLPGLSWIRRGTPVPSGTATHEFNLDPAKVRTAADAHAQIDVAAWMGGTSRYRATEQVLGLGAYGRTLTVISCPALGDGVIGEDEADDEEDLIESWTPRFRK